MKSSASWNWGSVPARHKTGGDLYPVLLLLRPYLSRYRWRITDLDAIGVAAPKLYAALEARAQFSIDELLSEFEDIDQVIDGTLEGVDQSTGEQVALCVVDNQHLDVVCDCDALAKYCLSLFGEPEESGFG